MKRLLIKFEDLFKLYSADDMCNEIRPLTKKIFIKSPEGELVPVRGIIKKTNIQMCESKFENGIVHKMATKHLIKCESGFRHVDAITSSDDILVYRNEPTKLKSVSVYAENGIAYDVSLDSPHEYITPNGLIHHNTTSALIIKEAVAKSDMDVFFINGSDNNGVEFVRDEMVGFLKSPPYKSKHKIILIDEADYLSQNAQAALRNIMEKYASNGRFLCTGNYRSKIIDPLISRFQVFQMDTIKEEYAIKYCESILKAEKIEYDVQTVKLIIQSLLPDVRKAVGTLQQNVIDGKLKTINAESLIDNEKKITSLIINICDNINKPSRAETLNSSIPVILEILTNDEPDYRRIYANVMAHPKLPFWAKIKANQYANNHQGCAIPSAHFMAMIYDILAAGLSFYKTFVSK